MTIKRRANGSVVVTTLRHAVELSARLRWRAKRGVPLRSVESASALSLAAGLWRQADRWGHSEMSCRPCYMRGPGGHHRGVGPNRVATSCGASRSRL